MTDALGVRSSPAGTLFWDRFHTEAQAFGGLWSALCPVLKVYFIFKMWLLGLQLRSSLLCEYRRNVRAQWSLCGAEELWASRDLEEPKFTETSSSQAREASLDPGMCVHACVLQKAVNSVSKEMLLSADLQPCVCPVAGPAGLCLVPGRAGRHGIMHLGICPSLASRS